ncbi:MAG TPA: 2-oxoglutarate and iron-dependent oxygenase domain-containing protein [Alcaligenes sp.]|nr:2-oxoglutarate and iron-dependent oxygenase domain-containing protein [Alcaligenes sp.]HRL28017.1 2-oxoglutarate and iron-dependent oxygenase domain-containing protein [Alcaligenes sp.]
MAEAGLPILDLQDFINGSATQRLAFVHALRETAHGVGFLYLRGVGLTPRHEQDVFALGRRFFALPQADKDALRMENSPHFRGYTHEGGEITRGEQDWREQFDVGAERPALEVAAHDPAWKRLQGPNQWPAALPELKPSILHVQATLTDAARHLLRALALALGQPEHQFDAAFADTPVQHVKLIRYPGRAQSQSQQGVGAHKDSGCLTFVLQETQKGLQVHYQGRWIDAPPIPGTVVFNLGEVLEILTDGFLRATLHRVVSPDSGQDRLSLAFFLSPRLDASLPSLTLPPQLAVLARGVERDPRNPLVPHTGENLLKGRLRSHLDVARRFYADVLAVQGTGLNGPSSAYD